MSKSVDEGVANSSLDLDSRGVISSQGTGSNSNQFIGVTNKTSTQTKDAKWDLQYQNKYGWWVFAFAIVLFGGTNLACFIYVTTIRPESTTVALDILQQKQIQAAPLIENVITPILQIPEASRTLEQNFTIATFNEQVQLSLAQLDEVEADSEKAWKVCLISGICYVALVLFILALVVHHRKTKKVCRKGKLYLAQLFACAFLCLTFTILISCIFLNQLPGAKVQDDVNKFKAILYFFIFMMLLSISGFYSALVNRSYIVYRAFNSTYARSDSILKLLWKNYLFQLFLFGLTLISVSVFILKFFEPDPAFWQLSTLLVPIIVYPVWISILSYKSRTIADEYSDFYTNVRCLAVTSITMFIVFIHEATLRSMANVICFQFATQFFISLYLVDQFSSLLFFQIYKATLDQNDEAAPKTSVLMQPSTDYKPEESSVTISV